MKEKINNKSVANAKQYYDIIPIFRFQIGPVYPSDHQAQVDTKESQN